MRTTTRSSQSGRPGTAISCSPPTDPTGFIYPTYRAAPTETQMHKHCLDSSHQGAAYVSSAVGGSVSTLSFEEAKASNQLRGSVNRRVAYVSRHDGKAVESL
jgi:hypothetical protein